jgi:hypothetical protein
MYLGSSVGPINVGYVAATPNTRNSLCNNEPCHLRPLVHGSAVVNDFSARVLVALRVYVCACVRVCVRVCACVCGCLYFESCSVIWELTVHETAVASLTLTPLSAIKLEMGEPCCLCPLSLSLLSSHLLHAAECLFFVFAAGMKYGGATARLMEIV